MIILLLGFVFILGLVSLGYMLSRLIGIRTTGNMPLQLSGFFIIGASAVSMILYILWYTECLDWTQVLLGLIFSLSLIYLIFRSKIQLLFVVIGATVLAAITTIYAAGNNFDLLWDAKASWLLKAKSIHSYNVFPGDLFINSITSNIAKDYPPWVSLLYGGMARFTGGWSEVNIKVIQSFIVVLVVCATFSIIYFLISKILKLKNNYSVLISLLVTLLLYANSYFYLYLQSGYIDYLVLLHWLVVLSGIILFLENSDSNWFFLSGITAFSALLVKNEGMAICTFFVLFLLLKYKKNIFHHFQTKNWYFITPVILCFVSWQLIKSQYGFYSPLVLQGDVLNKITHFVTREIIVVVLYIWEWVRNIESWFLSYSLGIASLIFILNRLYTHLQLKNKITDIFGLSFSMIAAVLIYLAPYGLADLGIGFFFQSTRDRIALQLIPVLTILALYIAIRDNREAILPKDLKSVKINK